MVSGTLTFHSKDVTILTCRRLCCRRWASGSWSHAARVRQHSRLELLQLQLAEARPVATTTDHDVEDPVRRGEVGTVCHEAWDDGVVDDDEDQGRGECLFKLERDKALFVSQRESCQWVSRGGPGIPGRLSSPSARIVPSTFRHEFVNVCKREWMGPSRLKLCGSSCARRSRRRNLTKGRVVKTLHCHYVVVSTIVADRA